MTSVFIYHAMGYPKILRSTNDTLVNAYFFYSVSFLLQLIRTKNDGFNLQKVHDNMCMLFEKLQTNNFMSYLQIMFAT